MHTVQLSGRKPFRSRTLLTVCNGFRWTQWELFSEFKSRSKTEWRGIRSSAMVDVHQESVCVCRCISARFRPDLCQRQKRASAQPVRAAFSAAYMWRNSLDSPGKLPHNVHCTHMKIPINWLLFSGSFLAVLSGSFSSFSHSTEWHRGALQNFQPKETHQESVRSNVCLSLSLSLRIISSRFRIDVAGTLRECQIRSQIGRRSKLYLAKFWLPWPSDVWWFT